MTGKWYAFLVAVWVAHILVNNTSGVFKQISTLIRAIQSHKHDNEGPVMQLEVFHVQKRKNTDYVILIYILF